MNHSIKCTIDRMVSSGEEAWIFSLPLEAVADAEILFTSLIYEKLSAVKFADKGHSAQIHTSPSGYTLKLNDSQIIVSKAWVEAVLGMLLEVCLNGWSDTSHLDQDFESKSVTMLVLPPEK